MITLEDYWRWRTSFLSFADFWENGFWGYGHEKKLHILSWEWTMKGNHYVLEPLNTNLSIRQSMITWRPSRKRMAEFSFREDCWRSRIQTNLKTPRNYWRERLGWWVSFLWWRRKKMSEEEGRKFIFLVISYLERFVFPLCLSYYPTAKA